MEEFKSYIMKRGAALLIILYLVLASSLNAFLKLRVFAPGPLTIALALLASIYLLSDARALFLPFLGETVMPPSVLRLATPTDSTIDVSVPALPGATHAIFWAANPSTKVVMDPVQAYEGFKNAGVVAVQAGTAVFPLYCPGPYAVRNMSLPKHLHYRFVFPNGILSRVFSRDVEC